jgi:rubrerythrin
VAFKDPERQRAYQRAYHRRRRRLRAVRWAEQRDANTERYQQELDRMRAANRGLSLAQYQAQPRVQLVCCGVWSPVTTLPHVCPACGRRYLEVCRG